MRKIKLVSIVVILVFNGSSSFAMDIIPSNSNYYYKMGGGSDLQLPPVTKQQSIKVGADPNLNLGFSCSGFNPAVSITNLFNNLGDSVQGLGQNLINSATGVLSGSAMGYFEKANHDAYTQMQNLIKSGQDQFNVNMKSCQDAMNNIQTGKSPYQDWFSIADSQGWLNYSQSAAQGQNVDINAASKQITKDPHEYGLPWVHGDQNSGGTSGNQKPIKVVYDTTLAGYNVMIDDKRHFDDQTAAPQDSELAKYWPTPDAAGKFSETVLGDMTISVTSKDSVAGMGLVPIMTNCPAVRSNVLTCVKTLQQKMIKIVQSPGLPLAKDLKSISSNQIMITPQIIETIKNMTPENQAITINKLSEDIAIQNLANEALLLRRLLESGEQIPAIQNYQPALNTVNAVISNLDKEIDDLLKEKKIKTEFMSETINSLLDIKNTANSNASSTSGHTASPAMNNGAIYKGQ